MGPQSSGSHFTKGNSASFSGTFNTKLSEVTKALRTDTVNCSDNKPWAHICPKGFFDGPILGGAYSGRGLLPG